ncbi:MAG: hypothetical protein KF764_34790 [Labilithrix sp.]|nr:hypothetical protein [Labilithrix sp.]
MAGFGSSEALIRRRSRRALAIVVAVALPCVLSLLAELTGDLGYQFFAALVACAEAVAFFLLPAMAPQGILTGERRGALRADRAGVWFRKKLALPRERIASVWAEEREDGRLWVHLSGERARDDLSIVVDDQKRMDALLEALDVRHDRHAASFVVASGPLRDPRLQRLARALVIAGGALVAALIVALAYRTALIGFALVPALGVYSMLVRRARLTTRLIVGTDGIVVRAGGSLRQISLASVTRVTYAGPDGIVVEQGSESLVLRFVGAGAEAKADDFIERVEAGRARLDVRPDPVASLLASAARSTSEWLVELRRLRDAGAGYRGAAVPDEELWRVVESPALDARARAGALAALGPRIDDEGRVRIAQIAGATARRDVRAALDAAAAGETDAEILDAFSRERPPEADGTKRRG